MGIIFILPLGVAAVLGSLACLGVWQDRPKGSKHILPATMTGLVIGIVILAITTLSLVLGRIGEINRFRAFQDYQLTQYDEAITNIRNGIQGEMDKSIFDAANLAQIQAYADAVTARRNAVNDYNRELVVQRYWESNWFIGAIYPDAPYSLDYLGESR